MSKTILITGSTDGIGLATAKSLVELGHKVLVHGRSEAKLKDVLKQLSSVAAAERLFAYQADLSSFAELQKLVAEVKSDHQQIDVLINNAGVFVINDKVTKDGLDTRFMVNTIAPYFLTTQLLGIMPCDARVVNLSSAAQAPLSAQELIQPSVQSDNAVYAKSKLALTMWSRSLALSLGPQGPVIVAVNPKSFLGSKMVEQAYGVAGTDLQIGADILIKAALSEEFADATGKYYDNDINRFTAPHPDAEQAEKIATIEQTIIDIIRPYVVA